MTGSGDRAVAIGVSGCLAAFGLVATALSLRMENPLQQPVGPGSVPAMVSACLTLFALGQTVSAWRRWRDDTNHGKVPVEAAPRQSQRSMGAAALIGASLWVWGVAGYLPGMILAVFGVMVIDRKVKPPRALGVAVFLGVSLWVLFDVMLKIDLG